MHASSSARDLEIDDLSDKIGEISFDHPDFSSAGSLHDQSLRDRSENRSESGSGSDDDSTLHSQHNSSDKERSDFDPERSETSNSRLEKVIRAGGLFRRAKKMSVKIVE